MIKFSYRWINTNEYHTLSIGSFDTLGVGDEVVDELLGLEHDEGDGVSLLCKAPSSKGLSVVTTLAVAIKLGGYKASVG